MTTASCSRYPQEKSGQNKILTAAKVFWQFSNFYGEYNAIAPQDRLNYVESLSQK